jgi:protein-S-isoprenylcysteine O-methyltransferase Ste14
LFNSRQIELKTNNYDQIEESGITIKGSYSFIRHPMQSGSILLFTFANTTFTFEKIIAMIFMTAFIYIGVTM